MKSLWVNICFLLICLASEAQYHMPSWPDSSGIWWKETTIYQIYPRSYYDSNNDGIGDLRGIINKLDYIKDLGFETIWVSPFYESPQADFGYDISNYYAIAPEYGTTTTVDSLITETHARGMKIVFDLVLNHTSDQHPWFKESASSKTNPKADWYIWHDGTGKGGKRPPNNWYNVLSQKAWHYNKERGQWFYTAFLNFQPDLNYRNPDVKTAMFNVVKHWLGSGVDGIRLDIFNCIMEDSLFRDNPKVLTYIPSAKHLKTKFQNRVNNINHADNFALAKELRDTIDKYGSPERFMIGEAIGSTNSIKPLTGTTGYNSGLNMVFLFDLIFYKFKPEFFRSIIATHDNAYPPPFTQTLVYGNHDNKRSISRVKNNLKKARLPAMFQMTARGVPVVYYGEEIGMTDTPIKKRDALDPISHQFNSVPQFIRKALPVPMNRDECRTPMQWDTTKNAGFSKAEPWLPINPDVKHRNVQTQLADTLSLLNTYKRLLDFRKQSSAIKYGEIVRNHFGHNRSVLSFARYFYNHDTDSKDDLDIYINFSSRPKTIKLSNKVNYALVYKLNPGDKQENDKLLISPYGGVILKYVSTRAWADDLNLK